jgi:hypothetical protein
MRADCRPDSAVSFPVSFLGLISESIHELLSPQCVAEFGADAAERKRLRLKD